MEMDEIFGGTAEEKTEKPKRTRKTAVKKTAAPKTPAKKAEPKKTETVKTEAAKTVVKKTAAKKPAAPRKASIKKEVFIQYFENQVDEELLLERVLGDCKEQNITVKDLKMYLKPEDNACYYVANGNIAGKVDLF